MVPYYWVVWAGLGGYAIGLAMMMALLVGVELIRHGRHNNR